MKRLTKTMRELMQYMQGCSLYRHPSGFWTRSKDWNVYLTSYGTSSVEALVSRGIAEYVEWKDGKRDKFPIRAVLVANAAEPAQREIA